ncbi:MAG TPA: hypothetical protein VL361_07195, partial [Candidatus Limnocylindrales bacterium]|nr:hypothetical protein [Candidatus Limnocylindrales bacterium]
EELDILKSQNVTPSWGGARTLPYAAIYLTFLDGGEQQRAMQRKAFYDVARSWADWWQANWNGFGVDESLADARLPEPKEQPSFKRFLAGPNIKASGGKSGMILHALTNQSGPRGARPSEGFIKRIWGKPSVARHFRPV